MSERRQSPALWSCGTGTAIGIGIVFFVSLVFLFAGQLLGVVFDVVLFLPDQLGVIERVKRSEIIEMDIPGELTVDLARGGTYKIIADQQLPRNYQIAITSLATNEAITVQPVPVDPLNPVEQTFYTLYKFQVEQPGRYNVSVHNVEQNTWTIVPDIPPNSDVVLLLSILLQGVAVLIIGRFVYLGLNKSRIQAERAVKQAKLARLDEWLDSQERE